MFPTHFGCSCSSSSEPELTPEERDSRTIFCMQLAARIRPKDLEEFFSAVGVVRTWTWGDVGIDLSVVL